MFQKVSNSIICSLPCVIYYLIYCVVLYPHINLYIYSLKSYYCTYLIVFFRADYNWGYPAKPTSKYKKPGFCLWKNRMKSFLGFKRSMGQIVFLSFSLHNMYSIIYNLPCSSLYSPFCSSSYSLLFSPSYSLLCSLLYSLSCNIQCSQSYSILYSPQYNH